MFDLSDSGGEETYSQEAMQSALYYAITGQAGHEMVML